MKTTLILSAMVFTLVLSGCNKDEETMKESSMFTVTIENVMEEKSFLSTGVFNTPLGATEPGGAGLNVTDLFRWAAHIDIDDLGAIIDVIARGLGHQSGVGPHDLYRTRIDLSIVVGASFGLVATP